ncbi:MAG: sulfite exporter TauE/SafE family protein, partial [Pseudomonadota bacterium]
VMKPAYDGFVYFRNGFMTLTAYLVAAFAVVLTGISKSGFAGGLGVLGVPLVAMFMPPQAAAVLLLPILIGIDLVSVWRYRSAWTIKTVLILLPGALGGIAVGMVTFADLDPDILRLGIGMMALGFVALYFWRRNGDDIAKGRPNGIKVFFVSALSGFAGFVAHAGGPPIKGTLLAMRLDKTAFVATNSIFFFILNVAKGVGYASLGLFSASGLLDSLILVPFLFLGVWLGFALHDRLSQLVFVRLAYGFLAVAGVNLVMLGLFKP